MNYFRLSGNRKSTIRVGGRQHVRCVAAIVVLCVGFGSSGEIYGQFPEPPSSVSSTEYQANMDRTDAQIGRMIASLDRGQFDLEPLLDRLDLDAETIIEFVAKEIVFQQYPGVLRGARGALMSRAGNAMDQSLLLATLLRDAGYDARIVEGRLTEPQVLQLMRTMQNPARQGLSSQEADLLLKVVAELNSAKRQSHLVKELASSLESGARRRGDLKSLENLNARNLEVINTLKDLGKNFDLVPIPATMIEEAAQYFWVEYREVASDRWEQIHPVFKEVPDSFSSVRPINYFASSIPQEYQQRITVSVEIEQSIGGEIRTHQVVAPWSRPSASLYGMELAFSNVPLNFSGTSSPLSQAASLEAAEFFVPILSGTSATSTHAFDLNGNVVPPDAVIDPAAGVIKQVGKKMALASAALNAATSDDGSSIGEHLPKLAGQTVKIELHVPGRPPRIFTKSLVPDDLQGFDSSGEPTMALKDSLTAQFSLGFVLGDYPDQFLLSETLDRIKQSRSLLDAIHAQTLNDNDEELRDKGRFANLPVTWGYMSTLVTLMHQAELPAGRVAYFAEPGVIVHRFRRDRYRNLEGSLDILSNTRRVFDVSRPELRVDPEVHARLGVWDTTIEGLFYPRMQASSAVVDVPLAANGGHLLTPVDDLSPGALPGHDIYRGLKRDLEAGFTLFFPASKLATIPGPIAWWRLDEDTGEMLGMLVDGTGGAVSVFPMSLSASEYIIKLTVTYGISGAFAYAGYEDCINATAEERCCAEMAVVGTIAGGTIGFGVSRLVLWELAITRLILAELAINSGVALYMGMDTFAELCQTTIFGDNGNLRDTFTAGVFRSWESVRHPSFNRLPAHVSERHLRGFAH